MEEKEIVETLDESKEIKKEVPKKEKKKNNKEIEKLQEEKNILNDKLLRVSAEMQNMKRRYEEEISKIYKYEGESFIKKTLGVVDNFERAISMDSEVLDDELSKFLSGFKLIYNHMQEILEKFGVEEVSCLGKIFDANFETSVFMDSDPNYDDEVVLDVLQKGYTYNDKLLRSASVKINKIENNNLDKEGNDINE